MTSLPEPKLPVFYDPAQRRWRRFRRTAQVLSVLLTIIFGVMIASILVNPTLPRLQLSPLNRLLGRPGPTALASPPQLFENASTYLGTGTPTVTLTSSSTPSPTGVTPTKTLSRPGVSPTATSPAESATLPGQRKLRTSTPPLGVSTPTFAAPTATPLSPATATSMVPPLPTAALSPSPLWTPPGQAHTPPPAQQTRHPTPIPTPHARVLDFRPPAAPVLSIPINSPAVIPPEQVESNVDHSRPLLLGFYVSWSEVSFASLQQNLDHLDAVVADWLWLTSTDGTLAPTDPNKHTRLLKYVRAHRPSLPILPLVNDYDYAKASWDGQRLAGMLADPAARARAIQSILDSIQADGFAGVSVDFEDLAPAGQPVLVAFMRELYARLHPLGLTVSEAVPFDNPDYDYRALAASSDYLILMSYDEHWSGAKGSAGPVASQKWFAAGIAKRFREVPADRLFVGIGSYGYDWKDGSPTATTVSFEDTMLIARDSQSPIRFEASSLNPTLDYVDEAKALHHIWFLDGVTAFDQLVAASPYHPRGLALWRLGTEDPSVWRLMEQREHVDDSVVPSLDVLSPGYDLDARGRGEILRVEDVPHDGARAIEWNSALGLITSERFSAYPVNYRVDRWGAQDPKAIALTFDDGPDGRFTSPVLDILERYQAPATFFVTGMNADLHADLLQRELDQGHEIGNHTFTHPDLTAIPAAQLQFELNATERVFESRLGVRSLLFRPPYGEDVDPLTEEQLKPLLTPSERGYFIVGMQIDPEDWRSPGVDKIVQEVFRQAPTGRVVLLHDGGGDRSQTVAALPQIIEGLRARGYRLVRVSDLMGVEPEQVMPPISRAEQFAAVIDGIGFEVLSRADALVSFLFAAGVILGALRLGFVVLLALVPKGKKRALPADYAPQVTTIVPAYNEEKVVCNTVRSLLRSTYPNLDIVVVDDGSTDGTYAALLEAFQGESRVRLYRKPNGGKADTLNYALERTRADLIVAIDADTIVLPDAVEKLVPHFADPRVGAVAGNAKVGNRINLLTEWQALEYVTSQNLDRRAFALLNGITVVPGAIGAWRRRLILDVGGFTNETLAEDAALTMAILRLGYRVEYDDAAIALTEAPDTLRGFLRQRFRWMYGTLQAAWKNLDALFRPRYGALGMVALPNILIFQVFFPIISPLMDLMLVVSVGSTLLERFQHPLSYSTDSLAHTLFYYALFLAMDYGAAFVAFMLERKEDKSLLVWLFFQRLFYRQLLYYVAIRATLTAIRGPEVGWGKLERKATVPGA